MDYRVYLKHYPGKDGRLEPYGGAYLAEELKPASEETNEACQTICHFSQFINELRGIRRELQERPTSVYHCERLLRKIGNCQTYLRREDLNHTGIHKLNHCMGKGLLARFMGGKHLIAEMGVGQHGIALATAAVLFGLECEIHMGEADITRQTPNVTRVKILGAKAVPVSRGLKTLRGVVDSALESYVKNYKDSIYCIGSALGSHPFPLMVHDFQSAVSYEARDQFMEMTGVMPDVVTACIGDDGNSIGMLIPSLDDPVDIMDVEPLGRGEKLGGHAAFMRYREKGVMRGFESIMLRDVGGEPAPVYSIVSGLNYPSIGPEHVFPHDSGRTQYETVGDEQVMEAFFKPLRLEGIILVIKSSHAVVYAMRKAKEMK